MKKAIVTGGAGFIGSHLTELLLKRGYGGAVATRDRKRWEMLKCLRWHGVPAVKAEVSLPPVSDVVPTVWRPS